MSSDRRRPSSDGRSGRPNRPGQGGRPGSKRGRPDGSGAGRGGPKRGAPKRGAPKRGAPKRGAPKRDRPDGAGERRRPPTEAERRAAEVRARRGPRAPRDEAAERSRIEARETEQWIDEGSVRAEATAATRRAGGRRDDRPAPELDPAVAAEIHAALSPDRAKRLTERLAAASAALDRERFEEARRMVTPLIKELPQVAAVHEVNGLACYRLGRWQQAARSLELARQLHPDPALLPVLADCYRALRRWSDVDAVWDEIKQASPAHDVMAEGRIVVANSFAERGQLPDAIALMEAVSSRPKRVRDHHLRQWYVLGDLYDRAGDTIAAANWFGEVARREPAFADVRERLRSLGR